MPDRFDGNGFDHGPIEGQEAAKIRHMFRVVSDSWVNLDDVNTVINGARILGSIAKWGGGMGAVMAVIGGAMKLQGWI